MSLLANFPRHISYLTIVAAFAVVIGVFSENKGRSWRRAARIAAVRHILRGRAWTPWELKSAAGATTAQEYAKWARKTGAEVLTDDIPEGAKLHWIGPRRMDRVLLYFHGVYTLVLSLCRSTEEEVYNGLL